MKPDSTGFPASRADRERARANGGTAAARGAHRSWAAPVLAFLAVLAVVASAAAQGSGLPDTRDMIAHLRPASPGARDSLSVGSGSGARGSNVTVPLRLANNTAVSALQADISFDPSVVNFTSGAAAGRGGGMAFGSAVLHQDTLRVLMYYSGADSLPAGGGTIANLTFLLLGNPGSQSALGPAHVTVVDPRAESVPVVTSAGAISVTSGGGPQVTVVAPNGGESWTSGTTQLIQWVATDPEPLQITLEYSTNSGSTWNAIVSGVPNVPPYSWVVVDAATPQGRIRVTANDGTSEAWDTSDNDFNIISTNPLNLYIAVLKNPARTRTFQVFVTADRTLDAPPAVHVDQARITMSKMTGVNIYQGSASVTGAATSVVITATGKSGSSVRTAQTSVNF